MYLDEDNGNVYQVIAGIWALRSNIQGPTGAAGADGADGDGWTSGAYNGTTGIVTFLSDDGLGFVTGDLRGDDGADGADGVPTDVSYMKRSSTSTMSVTSTPTIIPWDVSEGDYSGTDITYASNQFTAVVDGDYRFGGFATAKSAAQRPQAVVEIYIDGVATGFQRGGAYIRNSGVSYDFWTIEFSSEPFNLTAGQTVELRIGLVTGATYGYGGTSTVTLQGDASQVWFERISAGATGNTGPAATEQIFACHGPGSIQAFTGTKITLDLDATLMENPGAGAAWTLSTTGELTNESDNGIFLVSIKCQIIETGGSNDAQVSLSIEVAGGAVTGSTTSMTIPAGETVTYSQTLPMRIDNTEEVRVRAIRTSGTGTPSAVRFGNSLSVVRLLTD